MRLNSGLSLPPGSSLPVDVEVDRLRQRLVVPSTSLRTDEGKTYVWKLINNAAERVEVTTGPTSGQLVEIRQGLSEGDLVVVRGQSNLQSDMGVQIIGNL